MKISYGKNVYGKEEIRAVVAQLNQTTQIAKTQLTLLMLMEK